MKDFLLRRRRRVLVREMALLIDSGLGCWARTSAVMREIAEIDRQRAPAAAPVERHPGYAGQLRRAKAWDAFQIAGNFLGRMLLVLVAVLALNWAATLWP